jgi:hypothetical protein
MLTRWHLLGLVTTLFVLVACNAKPDSTFVAQLRWLETANAVADADRALTSGDHRLMAVHGYSLMIPGVDGRRYFDYEQRFGVRPIAGTSDFIEGPEHMRLVQLAHRYAQGYNTRVLAQMTAQ